MSNQQQGGQQMVNVADLDLQQLADVRRQLQEVREPVHTVLNCLPVTLSTYPTDLTRVARI